MAANDPLPDHDHTARYCQPTHCPGGVPSGTAFRSRPGRNETYLSVNWLELLNQPSIAEALVQVRARFAAKNYEVRPNGRFAIARVAEMVEHVRSNTKDGRAIWATHYPADADDSHAGINGYLGGADEDLIADLLAEIFSDVHPAVV